MMIKKTQINKDKLFLEQIKKKLIHHNLKCSNFKNFLSGQNIKLKTINKLKDLPYLHINLFKTFDLLSTSKKNIVMQLNSSGTTGSKSKIYLDKKNSLDQKIYLNNILTKEFGSKRIPYLILDQNPFHLSERKKFSAKIAAILGFGLIGSNITYLLDQNNNVDYQVLNSFLKKFGDKKFLMFGFTYKVYEIFDKLLDKNLIKYNFKKATLLHGGGWKKLKKIKINNKKFKNDLHDKFKIDKIINYFGFVEQTGSIFFECPEEGFFHTNDFTDIFVRNNANVETLIS